MYFIHVIGTHRAVYVPWSSSSTGPLAEDRRSQAGTSIIVFSKVSELPVPGGISLVDLKLL